MNVLSWYGGKAKLASKIEEFFPTHNIYVEPFGGGASVLLSKTPSKVEVYNDIDSGLVNFFRVLRDKNKFEELYHKLIMTPFSREEYDNARLEYMNQNNEVDKAYLWYIVAAMSFGGKFGQGWGYNKNSARHMAVAVSSWIGKIENMVEIHERLIRIEVEHINAVECLSKYDTKETLFYCDPPYISTTYDTRSSPYSFTIPQHKELVKKLLNLEGFIILSGYENTLYQELLSNNWKLFKFPDTLKSLNGYKEKLTQECLYLSPRIKPWKL